MNPFSYLRSIYGLDALDTRFVNSSSTPYKPISNGRGDSAKGNSSQDYPSQSIQVKLDSRGNPIAQPSKWKTPEFYIYYVVFIVTVPYMFWIAYDVSRPSDPNYHKYEHLLSPGWIPGRKIDVSDTQYSSFRENVPYLGLLVVFHPLLRRLYDYVLPVSPSKSRTSEKANSNNQAYFSLQEVESRKEQRATFDFGFAMIFLAALHGFSILKIKLILYANYSLATRLPRNYVVAATWIFNISVLFANELGNGYKFEDIAEIFSTWAPPVHGVERHNWGSFFDRYSGILPRWEITFNITVLRLISFNMDYYWSLNRRVGSPVEVRRNSDVQVLELTNGHKKKQIDPSNLSEKDRINTSANVQDYSFRNFVAYAMYAPLYIAGPIITFNDYISQLKYPPATIETARTIRYGFRFALSLLAMELILHYNYCVAIAKGDPNWSDYTPAQLSLLSYFSLHIIWLKLLLPWRFFRLWSLLDGIDPPENMLRCISNVPSTVAFWRAWHRSFNRWIIRYIYIPMGGTRQGAAKSVLNYLFVFTFVALWHDIQLNLLIWGWLVVFFMLPEVTASYLFPRKRWLDHLTAYRILCAIGVLGNLMFMMMANMVGFAVGVDGLKSIIKGIFRDYSGLAFLVTASSALFVGIQVMFELREAEMRKGIYLAC